MTCLLYKIIYNFHNKMHCENVIRLAESTVFHIDSICSSFLLKEEKEMFIIFDVYFGFFPQPRILELRVACNE